MKIIKFSHLFLIFANFFYFRKFLIFRFASHNFNTLPISGQNNILLEIRSSKKEI